MTRSARAATYFDTFAARLTAAVVSAENRTLTEAKYELEQASAGTLAPADLRRLDHPYAKRHGAARRNPAILNRKSGETARKWRKVASRAVRGGTRGRVTNRSKAAQWIKRAGEPASSQVERPVIARVRARILASRTRRLKAAVQSVLKDFRSI